MDKQEQNTLVDKIKNSNLAVPISIVIAGLLISISILISNKDTTPKTTTPEVVTIEKAAKAIGINVAKLNTCLESDKYVGKISEHMKDAQATGGNGTPWSIVVTQSGKKYPLSGAQSIDTVKALIEQALKDEVTTSDKKLDNLAPITIEDHIQGDINAPVKIVEFSDIDCPFCKKFHITMQEIMKTYGKENKVAWVYRHLPIKGLHPDAENKAEASECVKELGGNDQFWAFVDRLSK